MFRIVLRTFLEDGLREHHLDYDLIMLAAYNTAHTRARIQPYPSNCDTLP